MLVLIALFLSASVGAFAWFIANRAFNREVLVQRISTVFDNIYSTTAVAGSIKIEGYKDVLSYEDCGNDRIKQDLFLAGVRKQGQVKWILLFHKAIIFFPFIYLGWRWLMNSLNWNLFFYALVSYFALSVTSSLLVRGFKIKRQKKIKRAMPEFFDLMIVCLEAGLNFTAALPRVIKDSEPDEPLVKELDLLYHEFLSGLPLPVACERATKRCQVPEFTRILNAIVQSDKMGTSLSNTLRVQAAELRDKLKQLMREKAHKIPVKLIFPIALILVGVLMPLLGGTAFYRLYTASQMFAYD